MSLVWRRLSEWVTRNIEDYPVKEGAVVLFAKYSPHTQMISVEGEDMKVIRAEDIIAVE